MGPVNDVFGHLDLNQLAKKEHGSTAYIKQTGEHLYDWKAIVNGVEKGLNMGPTYRSIYGDRFLCFATGVHAYDWKMVDRDEVASKNYVVPILYVPSDLFYKIDEVRKALKNVESMMSSLQDFYYANSGRYFKWIPPLICLTRKNNSAVVNGKGDNLIEFIESEFINSWDIKQLYDLSQKKDKITVMAFTKVTVSNPTYVGGKARANFCVIPPHSLEYPVTDWTKIPAGTGGKGSEQDRAFYVLAHEGGHALGLPHTCEGASDKPACEADPKNATSVMHGRTQYWVKNNNARIGPYDVAKIKTLNMFRYK